MVIGIVATSAYREERILVMKPGEAITLAGYTVAFRGVAPATGPNYREDVGLFDVSRGAASIGRLEPAKRVYDVPPQPTTEAGIHASWRGDLYVVLGDEQKKRRLRGARLLQSAGALHLDRRADHVRGRPRVAHRPAAARRRTRSRAPRRPRPGRVRPR